MPGEKLRPFIITLIALLLAVIAGPSVVRAQSTINVEQIVAEKVQPIVPDCRPSALVGQNELIA